MSIELPTREVSANDFAYIMFIRTNKERTIDDGYIEELIRDVLLSLYEFPYKQKEEVIHLFMEKLKSMEKCKV